MTNPIEALLSIPPCGDWEEKIWGRTRPLFMSPQCQVHLIEAKAGYCCSQHLHRGKANRFVVLDAPNTSLDVMERLPNGTWGMGQLKTGEVHDVEAGVLHRFQVRPALFGDTGLLALEIYWPSDPLHPVSLDDIHRLDVGGLTAERPLLVRP